MSKVSKSKWALVIISGLVVIQRKREKNMR